MGADEQTGWSSFPLDRLVTVQKGRKVPTSQIQEAGLEPYLGAAALTGEPTEFADPRLGVCSSPSDVLILWDGERSGLVGRGRHGVVSSTVASLSPTKSRVTEFLVHLLQWKYPWIQAQRTGTGVPHVPADLTRRLSLSIPSDPSEQRRIAEILDTLDEAIRRTEGLIAKLKQVRQGLLHDLLTLGINDEGELRDPIRNPELFVESSWGLIPRAWELRALDTVRATDTPITYGVLKPGPYVVGGIPLLQIEDVIHGEVNPSSVHRIGPDLDAEYARTRVHGGELVVSLVGTIGRVAQLPLNFGIGNLHRNLGLLRIGPAYVARFFLHCLSSSKGQSLIRRTTLGTTQSLLNLGALRALPVPVPPVREQQAIATALDATLDRITTEAACLEKLRAAKLGSMEDLLTGRVRVTSLLKDAAA